MDRQPDRRRVGLCPFDPVAGVRGDFDPVAGLHVEASIAVLETKLRGACQQHDEFVVGLVVPEAGWARLAGRDDALDAETGTADQALDLLLCPGRGQAGQEIAMGERLLHGGPHNMLRR